MSQLARRETGIEPRALPTYVLNLRPVEVIVRAARVVMSWALALRILAILFGAYGLVFLLFWVAAQIG